MTQIKRLLDKYRPLFLQLLLFGFILSAQGQTYNASTCCTVSNKAYGAAQAVSTDGRSWFYDATNFVMRDYNGTTEVFSYLNLAKYRSGHFPIFVHSGGVLQGNGVWLGGSTLVYWFKDSTGNANLVRWYTDSTGVSGGPFFAVANHLSEGNAGLIKGSLALDNVDNTSDAQKNAAAVALTNHTIDGNSNTLSNIANSSLAHSTIGLTLNNTGATPQVTTTPAALGASLVLTVPWANGSDSGFLRGTDWSAFHTKNDSTTVSNDSLYNWVNGTRTLQSVIAGTGGVNSVDRTNASLLFSPTTGNVLGQVNPAFTFNWTGQHDFLSFAPIFSTLTTAGGVFYGDAFGQLLETGAGTSGQILESNGGTAPTFFTPDATTVEGWLGFTPLSNALGSTKLFVGNGSNIATGVNVSQDASINNTGAWTNTGLKTHAIPSLSVGDLRWNGSAWVFHNGDVSEGTWPIVVNSDTVNFDKYSYNQKLTHSGINARGDSVYWYGDSWTHGQNCTGGLSALRYSTVVTQAMAGLEVNFGVSGSTLEKRSPIDRFTGVNMIDRLGTVPTKTFNRKMLVYSFGLNDWGVGGGNYDSANFETDYDSVIHYTLLQGWDTSQILILTPPWVGAAGAAYYSTINGGTTPTNAALVSFVNAAINVATRWRIRYVDLYHDMLKNDTTLFAGSGQGTIHPCDSGYAYLGADVIQFISPGVNGTIGSVPRFINNSALAPSSISDDLSTVTISEPLTTSGPVTIGNPFGRIVYVDQANGHQYFSTLVTSDNYFIYDVPGNQGLLEMAHAGYLTLPIAGQTLTIGEPQQTTYQLETLGNVNIKGQIDVSGPIGAAYWHRQDNNARTWAWYTPDGSFRANNGSDELTLASTGQLQLNEYGVSAFTGTAATMPAFTSTGNIIEVNASGVSRYNHTRFTPVTGGTVNLTNNQYNIIDPAGALLALTVNLPSSPANNDVVYIKFTQTITTVTYANGTVVDGIAGPAAGGLVVLTYDSGTTRWY